MYALTLGKVALYRTQVRLPATPPLCHWPVLTLGLSTGPEYGCLLYK